MSVFSELVALTPADITIYMESVILNLVVGRSPSRLVGQTNNKIATFENVITHPEIASKLSIK